VREPMICFDHDDRRSPEYRRGVRQLAAWHEECRIRRLAAAGDETAKKYLKNRSMHYRYKIAESDTVRMARGMA